MKEYKYIRIEKASPPPSSSGEASLWVVISKRGGHYLGSLRWYSRWRQYAFYPIGETVFSAGCLRDIASFIDVMMKTRKK